MESRLTNKRKGDVTYNDDSDVYIGAGTIEHYREEDVVETLDATPYNSNKIKLQLRITAKVVLPGSVSGKEYVWQTSGAVVEVDEDDAPGLLEKRIGDKACCGGNPENLKLFVLIGD